MQFAMLEIQAPNAKILVRQKVNLVRQGVILVRQPGKMRAIFLPPGQR